MAKKIVDARERLLQAFVQLRKKNPKNYPRVADLLVHCEMKKAEFYKTFKDVEAFYAEADQVLKKSLSKSELGLLTEKGRPFDPSITKEQCIEDLRRVQEEHPLSFITRTRYRNDGKYPESVWTRYFGTFHEFKRQAKLERTRQQHQLEKHIAKHVANDHYRDWFTAEVLPYHNKYVKQDKPGHIKTLLVASDIHDKEADEFCLSVIIDTAAKMQPDIIVLNGDIFDLYEFSKYDKDPRREDLKGAFDFVRERIFGPLRAAAPNAQIDFIMGNHEFRLLREIADASPHLRVLMSDILGLSFAKIFGLDEFQINWVSKLDLSVFTKQEMEKQLKANYKIYFECYAVTHEPDSRMGMSGTNGHHHKAELKSFNSPMMGEMTWVQTPGVHVSDAEYLKGLSPWNTGFLIVHINTQTKEVVQNIIQTQDWAVVNGVYYAREEKV